MTQTTPDTIADRTIAIIAEHAMLDPIRSAPT